MKIENFHGERLDVVEEGRMDSDEILLFVHGFGTGKNEGFIFFVDIARHLQNDFHIFRFDLSGYGFSEGQDSDFDLDKAASDINAMLNHINNTYNKKVNIIAHSLGSCITAKLNPDNVARVIFTSPTQSDTSKIAEGIQDRIKRRGGEVNETGITMYPRASGLIQKIGSNFWDSLREFDVMTAFHLLAKSTDLTIIRPEHDDVIHPRTTTMYEELEGADVVAMSGDHNFSKPKDREQVLEFIGRKLGKQE